MSEFTENSARAPEDGVPSDADPTTEWFAERIAEQREAHRGSALREWADTILRELPPGPVALLSMSAEGCALSAVVAALRDETTTWEQLALGRPQPQRACALVVVEPVRLGEGLLESLSRLLPDATVIDGFAAMPTLASVA